jgi:hypothetical protein
LKINSCMNLLPAAAIDIPALVNLINSATPAKAIKKDGPRKPIYWVAYAPMKNHCRV